MENGYEVLFETNGTQDISLVDDRCVKIVDIKCPSSGMDDKNDLENLKRLTQKDELKFVIGNKEDYEYAKKVLNHGNLGFAWKNIVNFSPVFGKMDPKLLIEWMLEDHLKVRLNLQIHKFIWYPEKRGV